MIIIVNNNRERADVPSTSQGTLICVVQFIHEYCRCPCLKTQQMKLEEMKGKHKVKSLFKLKAINVLK